MYSLSSLLGRVNLTPYFTPFFAVTLGSAAILFGGVQPIMQAILPILCAILLALSAFQPAPAPLRGRESRLTILGCFLPLFIVLAISAAQLFPIASGHLANGFWSLSPTPTPWPSISFNPGLTMSYLALTAGYVAFALAVYRTSRTNPAPLLKTFAVLVTALSFYGLFIYATGNASVLWLTKVSYTDSLTATFINRNSFATFAGLGMLACMGLFLRRVGEISSRLNVRQRLTAFWLIIARPNWVWLCCTFICMLALALTNSRAGLLASLSGLLILLGSLAGMRPAARWPLVAIIGALFLLGTVFLIAVGDRLAERLQTVAIDGSTRSDIYTITQTIISQYPWLGTGLGTYQPAVATSGNPSFLAGMPFVIEHAHNTYLELATELGYPAMALLALSALLALAAMVNGLINRRRAVMWPALGIATMVLVGGHALVDFSLSVPAVALATIAILTMALAQSFPQKEQKEVPILKPVRTIVALTAAVLLAGAGGWLTSSEYFAHKTESTVATLAVGQPVPTALIKKAQSNLQTCLAINPWHPTCGFSLAQTNLSIATNMGLKGSRSGTALIYLFTAKEQYEASLSHAPTNPHAWYKVARIDAYTGNPQAAITALANSILTGPAEPALATRRIPLMLSLLPQTSGENRTLFTSNILELWRTNPWAMATEIRPNRLIHSTFAALLGDTEQTRQRWQHVLRVPYPAP